MALEITVQGGRQVTAADWVPERHTAVPGFMACVAQAVGHATELAEAYQRYRHDDDRISGTERTDLMAIVEKAVRATARSLAAALVLPAPVVDCLHGLCTVYLLISSCRSST